MAVTLSPFTRKPLDWPLDPPLDRPLPARAETLAPPPARQHVAYLDGLRALAALFVVLHHTFWEVVYKSRPLSSPLEDRFHVLWYGHYAVDVFIVLSGFCLALPVVRGGGRLAGGAWKFFGKRARRILPPYFLALGLSLLLIYFALGHKTGTLWDFSLPVTGKAVLAHLLLIQDASPHTCFAINPALWSVSVEWRIYFLFPALVLLCRRWGATRVAVGTTALSYATLYAGQNTALGSLVNFQSCGVSPQYLGLFTMGMLAADIACSGEARCLWLRDPGRATGLLAVTTLLLLVSGRQTFRHGDVFPLAYADFFVGVWALALLVAASDARVAWLHRALSWRPLASVGTFAYSIYLIHTPLIQVLWQYVFVPLQGRPTAMFLALCFAGTPLIVGASYLFHLVCERPFLGKRKQGAEAPAAAPPALVPAFSALAP